jgi:hypothetical protein
MPLSGKAKTEYQRRYMKNWMRAHRARRRVSHVKARLASVQQEKKTLLSQMAALIPTAGRVYYRPATPPPEPPLWSFRAIASPQSPPCLIDFSGPTPTYTDAFSTHTRWRK